VTLESEKNIRKKNWQIKRKNKTVRYGASLIIKEMQIKSSIIYYLTAVRMNITIGTKTKKIVKNIVREMLILCW
jgi:hypothetical protein